MAKKTLFKNYISPEGEERIKKYQYNSQSSSIVYKYLMGPLANIHVNFLPATLAPNTITIMAFLFNVVPHLLIASVTGENLSVEIPRWLFVFTGICQFLYMHFDNMDGKQARRTGSSSSLGMLYDHGLDSVSGWIMALNLGCAIRLENGLVSYCCLLLVPVLGFYFTMWEEYHLDFLNFGMINPVDEGITIMNLILIFSGIVGSSWWTHEAFFGLNRNHVLAIMVVAACVFGIIANVMRVLKRSQLSKQQSLETVKVSLFLVACMLTIACFSPSNIVERRTRSLVTCFGLGFCKVIGHIQLAHCAGDVFYQWRRSFIFSSSVLVINTLLGFWLGKFFISEDLLLTAALIFNLWCYLHYILSITQQLTRVLGIKVFSIEKAKEK